MKITYENYFDEQTFNVLRRALFDYLRFLKSESCKLIDKDSCVQCVRSLLARLDMIYDSFLDPSHDVAKFELSIFECKMIYQSSYICDDFEFKSQILDELCQCVIPDNILD